MSMAELEVLPHPHPLNQNHQRTPVIQLWTQMLRRFGTSTRIVSCVEHADVVGCCGMLWNAVQGNKKLTWQGPVSSAAYFRARGSLQVGNPTRLKAH